MTKGSRYDEIGIWTEIKLDIIREYATAYSTILSAQKTPSLYHVYIDAFAGWGVHVSRSTGTFVRGSPLNALLVNPPFKEYYFIDLDKKKVDALAEIAKNRQDVHVYEGDCNQILLDKVFPGVRFGQFRRGLCLLDPYGLDLNWNVIHKAGSMKSLEIFLNFPLMDMNRNVLRKHPEKVDIRQRERMTGFWGDDSWRTVAYESQPGLFGDMEEKAPMDAIVKAFRQRLMDVAGFRYVPPPLPMRNKPNAVVYYLFFASQNETGKKIVGEIFRKYSGRVT